MDFVNFNSEAWRVVKVILTGVFGFIVGLVLAGFVALKFFVYGAQSVSAAEIQFYANTLQSIRDDEIDIIVKRSCFALPIAIENKAQMDNKPFSTDFDYGVTKTGENIEDLARKHLSKTGICQSI